MPKTRSQKEEILAKTQDRLTRSSAVVFVNISGVKVDQIEAIRDGLFTQGLQLQVAKNNLFKIALENTKLDIPAEILDQPLGMIFSYEDQVAAAKTVTPFAKEIEALEVVGGIVDGSFITAKQVEALALLPSREQLLGQLVGTIAAPLSGMVNVMAGNLRGLVQVLSQIQNQKA
jgi:large subunit ribosomal protein L10